MHPLALFFALLFFHPTFSTIAEGKRVSAFRRSKGFTIDLIHRDSPLSPFYNSSMTQSELLQNAALRSLSRANRFHLSVEKASELTGTDIFPNNGNYLMKIFIGTPPVERWTVADTGSDLIWVQCSPCPLCYHQDASLFDPTQSSTYMALGCDSKPCQLFPPGDSGCGTSNECKYKYGYVDQSYTMGDLASESITFGESGGQSASFPKSVFGCGHNNDGIFNERVTGLVGLGNGPLSLVSQLGHEIGRKFSYCLPPFNAQSPAKLRFGEEATISSNGVMSTPLIINPHDPTSYYLILEGISVGEKTVQTGQSNGNIVIDSGTTLILLPSQFYEQVEALVKEAIGDNEAIVKNPQFKLCYANAESIKKVPSFVVHFTGANLSLNSENIFLTTDTSVCFAVFPTDGLSIYGNVAQTNFEVEYDLDGRKVSFAPKDCTKQ